MLPAHPFFMLRHGETDWNRDQRFQGQTDIPVNVRGRSQAAAYAQMLRATGTDLAGWRFVASPLMRTCVTMEIMRDNLGLDPLSYETDIRLLEVTYGDWERQKLADLARRFPEEVAAREADKWNYVPPGGESYAMAVGRVRAFLSDLSGPAVIVAHGGVLRATRHIVEGISGAQAAEGTIPQDDIYAFDGKTGRWLSQA